MEFSRAGHSPASPGVRSGSRRARKHAGDPRCYSPTMASWQNTPSRNRRRDRAEPELVRQAPVDIALAGERGLFRNHEVSGPRSWRSFATSYVAQALALVLLVQLGISVPKELAASKHYQAIELIADREPAPRKPVTVIKPLTSPPRVLLQKIAPPKIALPEPAPPVVEAKVEPPPLPVPTPTPSKPQPKVETGKFDSAPAPVARGNPTKELETGVFSGSSA